ncbi:MAG: hypothetical protein P4L55_07225, partial [Syntrophobacteraceae bacterium]|nr:hypothetical protein [Syntrophobacteraceae bacterium]
LSTIIFASTALSGQFERAPAVLQTSDVLHGTLIHSPNYTVRPTVVTDGFINTYYLDTNYGALRVESTALLLKRIGELNTIAKIEQLKKSNVYMTAFKQVAKGPINTATGLVTDPAGTVSNTVSGIGQLFSNVGSTVTSDSPHKGKLINSASGQAAYKRQYAAQFGVDPYTSYEPLQKALNELSWTAAAGGLTVKAAFMAIPGGAGLAVGAMGTANTATNLLSDKTPAELARINQSTLAGMGVSDASIQAFMQNPQFDPYEQTLLVNALASMTGVGDRGIYIDKAAAASDESVAVFLRVRAQLMSLYNNKTHSGQRFVDANGVPVLLTNNGKIMAIFPLDYILWTSNFARKAQAVSLAIKQIHGVSSKELWVTGKLSPIARKALEAKGWKVEERAREKLAGS